MKNWKLLIVLLIFTAILMLFSSCQQIVKEKCTDECSTDSCDGFEYMACLANDDGCKDEVNEGLLKGKCGVECLSKLDCEEGLLCSPKYKCKSPEPVCGNGVKEEGETCLTCPADVACRVVGCGDGEKSGNENCGTCPADAGCSSDETCIDDKCTTLGWFKGEGVNAGRWCQWRSTPSLTPNLPPSSFDKISYTNCPLKDTSLKLVDGIIAFLDDAWYCKSDGPVMKYPVEAAVKLKVLTNINKVNLIQSQVTDDWNAKNVKILISADSKNGKDGHWKEVASTELSNSYSTNEDIMFTPISAKWIKVSVENAWEEYFALSEMKVYGSKLYCEKTGPGPLVD